MVAEKKNGVNDAYKIMEKLSDNSKNRSFELNNDDQTSLKQFDNSQDKINHADEKSYNEENIDLLLNPNNFIP